MHSLPGGQRDDTHAGGPSPPLEQPTGGASAKAKAAAAASGGPLKPARYEGGSHGR